MTAYAVTAGTWDTQVDATSAYATQRAAVYLTSAQREAMTGYDPDTARGQAEFNEARLHSSYTTVTVDSVRSEGIDPDQDGDVHRIVRHLVTITPRDGSAVVTTTQDMWVTVTREDDGWAVENARTRTVQD